MKKRSILLVISILVLLAVLEFSREAYVTYTNLPESAEWVPCGRSSKEGELCAKDERNASWISFFDKNTQSIFYLGTIDGSLPILLKNAASLNPNLKYLVISSRGGIDSALTKAIDLVNKHSIVVVANADCSSACAILWSAANNRSVLPNSRLGFHQAGYSHFAQKIIYKTFKIDAAEKRYRDAYQKAGFTPEQIKIFEETPTDRMFWVSASDAEKLVTHRLGASANGT